MTSGKPLVVNGWTLFAHPIFLDQLEALTAQVEALKSKDPTGYIKKNATKRLAAIAKLAFEVIPQDPARPEYRQGSTLGDENKHWFRAKFFQQYRLFFRFHAQAKMVVFAWVNDEDTKRAYESADDAYRVFRRMLDNGRPPSDWTKLLAEARAEGERFGRLAPDEG
ncbi:type II toxin-antitoxin system YhaV family toxin [Acidovorax sp. SUPP3434]|uniref:type II toxin-antitoxin system YhaV family toxin n=1 Tax=Acidovorax sp. SUPP3434 TaxID=2920880 RepID=UPI0023DE538D|nr:type II toxin-antitoxin system YhaV family toxin [Acidovorax sp. SUPP3434]GKT00358.1 type II toxin-antitoxin system YhaV family toxin [Acidovorax sp. SUPP3434]